MTHINLLALSFAPGVSKPTWINAEDDRSICDVPMDCNPHLDPTGRSVAHPATTQTLRDFIVGLRDAGSRPALHAFRRSAANIWSYGTLADQADRLANGLATIGIGHGDRVALCAAHGPEWIVAALGTILAGATLVPVDPQSDPHSLSHIAADCGARLWFTSAQTDARLQKHITGDIRRFRLDQTGTEARSWQALFSSVRRPPHIAATNGEAVLFYTSGTTGIPKGVPLSHRNLLFQAETLRGYHLDAASGRVLLALPLHHVYPFSIGLLGILAYRGTIVIPRALTGPEIRRAIQEGSVTAVVGVPRLFEVFLTGLEREAERRGKVWAALFTAAMRASMAARKYFGIHLCLIPFRRRMLGAFGALRVVVSGGAPLEESNARKMDALGWTVAAGYGLTETAPLLTILPPGDKHFDSVGKPISGVDLRIAAVAPEEGMPPTGRYPGLSADIRVGEVQVRGPGVFAGYRNLPDRTAQAFTPDGWFRTEDLGFLDRGGYLHILGRQSTLIVTPAGENIQPEPLEAQFATAPVIREIGILQRDGRLVAVVVPDIPQTMRQRLGDPEQVVRQAVFETGQTLPSHHRLARYVISPNALARTRLGKIRRAELERRFAEIDASPERRAAGTSTELSDDDKTLLDEPAARAVWEWLHERFPDRPLSPDTVLAIDLGIDSLEWINMTMEIRERVGLEISEEATARIGTLRDLLNEAVTSEQGAPGAGASLADEPERFISPAQVHWLHPLTPGEKTAARVLHAIVRWGMRYLFRLTITGQENLPTEGNFIIAPNHASVLDPFVVAAALDYSHLRHTCMAGWTGMAFANWLFRLVSRLAQALPIEIERAAFSSLAMSLVVLRQGRNLVWFPEGGRSHDGTLQPFLPGIALLLEYRRTPVVPVWIGGTYAAMPTGQRFPRLRPLTITIGRPIDADELEALGRGTTRRQRIADGLRAAVRSLAPPQSPATGSGRNSDILT